MATLGVKHACGDARRDAIVAFVAEHWRVKGWAPTMAEIAEAVGLRSVSTVHRHVQLLIDGGVLARQRGSQGSLRVVEEHAREDG